VTKKKRAQSGARHLGNGGNRIAAALIFADSQIISAAARESESGCGNQTSGSSWGMIRDSDAASACPLPYRPSLAPSRRAPSLAALGTSCRRLGVRVWDDLDVRLGIAARAVGCPTITVFSTIEWPVKRPCAGSPSWMIQPPTPRRQRDQIEAVRRRPSQTVRRELPRTTWRAYGYRLTDRKRPPLLDRLCERPMQNYLGLQPCCDAIGRKFYRSLSFWIEK
jgi:hypothetical protein